MSRFLTTTTPTSGNARWWGLVGLVPLGTAIVGYCPPYAWVGINSCGRKEAAPQP